MAKKITVIPSVSESLHTQMKPRIRVCGYARVSTASMAQADSYAAQVGYYTEKIQSNPLWEFAGVYADEGITGTKAKGRYDFNEMIAACEDGDIDLILTKSITRFARNTVDCIQTIRKLKAIGVGITFEKENINTLEEKSELLLTIMASVAQGESEDFSGNNRWAVISRFEKGTFIVGTPAYGYRKDEDGNLMIEEKEAEVVRLIFESYLNGTGTYLISKMLNEQNIPTIRESEQWQDSVIKEILKNPVYEGDALRQRTYTEKQFPFVRRGNTGQMPMYLTRDAHPAIVTHEEAEAVRSIMEYRSSLIQNPELTEKYQEKPQQISPAYRKLETRLENIRKAVLEEGADTDMDTGQPCTGETGTEELTALIFERAVERYKTLEVRDEDIHSEEMKETLAGREEITEFDEELYRKLIKQILVYKDNSVKVIFHNNNSIQIGYGEE